MGIVLLTNATALKALSGDQQPIFHEPRSFPISANQSISVSNDPLEIREKIYVLEAALLKSKQQVKLKPTHYFANNLYAREIHIPAGTLLTGHIHKTEHLNIISQGKISVLTENGIETLTAPCTIVSPPGTKRVGFVHEDTVWTTVHGTKEQDLIKLEQELIAINHTAYFDSINTKLEEL